MPKVKQTEAAPAVAVTAPDSNESAVAAVIVAPALTEDKLLTTTKEIEQVIADAVTTSKSAMELYQLAACSTIVHLHKHSDIRLVRRLIDTIPEGIRKASMMAFFDRFAKVAFDDDDVATFDKDKTTDLAGALAMPWYKAKVQESFKPFNLLEVLIRARKQTAKKLEKGIQLDKGDLASQEMLNTLDAAIKTLEGQAAKLIPASEEQDEAIAA